MKKLCLIAAVAASLVGNAASVLWSSSAVAYGVADPSAATTDGASVSAATKKMKGNGTWTYVMTILSGGSTVDTINGTVAFGSTGKISTSFTTTATAGNYDYSVVITGGQTGLGEGTTISTTLSGSFTVSAVGDSGITSAAPSSWTVSAPGGGSGGGAPEPTSGLLLLVGAGMLALRRKQK